MDRGSQRVRGNLALLVVGALFGASSPLARAMGTWLSPFGVVAVRFLFALPFALGAWYVSGHAKKSSHARASQLIPFSILFPASVCFYTLALFHTKISLAIFSFYIANIAASVILGKLFNSERLTRNKQIALLFTLAGVVALTNPFEYFAFDTGMLFGLFSGVLQSIASLYQKRLSKQMSESAISLVQVGGGIVAGLIAVLIVGDRGVLHLPSGGLMLAALFGIAFFFINYLMVYGFKRADIGTGTLLLSSELFFGPAIAYLAFSEVLGTGEIVAGALTVIAVYFVSRSD